jgi:Fe2+ or Zn2+ uptake regulation protein
MGGESGRRLASLAACGSARHRSCAQAFCTSCLLTIVVDSIGGVRTADELMAVMRAQGLRVTPQRMCIVAHLVGNTTHPTVEALYDASRVVMPTISLKTVYQTVHDLEALGEVRLVDLGTGQVRVDPNVEHSHHHLVCNGCGRVVDVPVDFAQLSIPPRHRRGFRVDAVDVIFRGTCDECRAGTRAPTARAR